MLVTSPEDALTHLVGAMGGDAQPQIISQLLARLLRTGQDPATAISAPRLALDAPAAGPFPTVVGVTTSPCSSKPTRRRRGAMASRPAATTPAPSAPSTRWPWGARRSIEVEPDGEDGRRLVVPPRPPQPRTAPP